MLEGLQDEDAYIEPALRAAAFHCFLVLLIPRRHLISWRGRPGLGRAQVGQADPHQVGQYKSYSDVVANAYPDPLPEQQKECKSHHILQP